MSAPESGDDALTLRAATAADEDFLRRVYASTREAEMQIVPWTESQKDEFLRMQFHAQHTFYHAEFPDAAYDVLLRGSTPIGRLYVDRRPDEIAVLDIALLPEYRSGGVGTTLMHQILDEAASAGKPVRLHVESFNRARHLYDRLGFLPVRTDGIYVLMEWNPNEVPTH